MSWIAMDAVEDHNNDEDKQSEGEVIQEWITNHFPPPFLDCGISHLTETPH